MKCIAYRFLVLELCAGTLKDFCTGKYKGPALPSDALVLYQIANGLDYIHSKDLIHRDIKPGNILISNTIPIQMKLSDFGLSKKLTPNGTFDMSGFRGTENWIAPEIMNLIINPNLPHGTVESDIFVAGCVFFYFLTRGSHPFGDQENCRNNINNGDPILLTLQKGKHETPKNLCVKKQKQIQVSYKNHLQGKRRILSRYLRTIILYKK